MDWEVGCGGSLLGHWGKGAGKGGINYQILISNHFIEKCYVGKPANKKKKKKHSNKNYTTQKK